MNAESAIEELTKVNEKVIESILDLNALRVAIDSIDLTSLPKRLTYDSIFEMRGRILFIMKNYEHTKKLLTFLRKKSKDEFKLGFVTFSDGFNCMVSKWSNKYFEVHFHCSPEEFPVDLLPTDDCKIVKKESKSKVKTTYSIQCPTK